MSRFVKVAISIAGNVVKFSCICHCYFEYVSDFVCVGFSNVRFIQQVNNFIFGSIHLQCSGPSMEPTLFTNNVLLTERISKRFNGLDRGDIVVSKNPENPEQFICKRIVGLPGDKITLKPRFIFNPFTNSKATVPNDGTTLSADGLAPKVSDDTIEHDKSVHINNVELSMGTFQYREIYVPKGMVWLEGDNSENSTDSRTYGPVPIGLIQSRVLYKVWPLHQVKSLI